MAGIFKKTPEEIAELELKKKELGERRRHEEWLKTPLGLATTAKEAGNGFFELELEIGSSNRNVSFGTADFGKYKKGDFTGLLSQIEDIGWNLQHVGYYFMTTGETSRDKFLASGQNVAVKGKTMGVYLFRHSTK
jgi:hypothetical protein